MTNKNNEGIRPSVEKLKRAILEKQNFTEFELYDLLEEFGFSTSYKNIMLLKEAIDAIGSTDEAESELIEPDENTSLPDELDISDELPEEDDIPVEDPIKDAIDSEDEKPITKDSVTQSLVTERLTFKHGDKFIKSFLTEDCNMPMNEFLTLTEEAKQDSVKEIVVQLLRSIEEKLSNIDTSPADRSRGDIHNLKELHLIQDAISQLEAIIERDENANYAYSDAVGVIIKSIYHLNTYASVFRDAYRNKKTVLIMKYQSIILSIISSICYLISTILDFKSEEIHLKPNKDISNFAPLQTLRSFVKSVDSGEFQILTRDVSIVREFYLEVPVSRMSLVLEAADYNEMIVDGIKTIYTALNGGNMKLNQILYKAAGYIVLILSLRDVFYSLFRMKTKVSDMISGLQQFTNLNLNGGAIMSKLINFTNKFQSDGVVASDLSKREVEDENRKLLTQVKKIQAAPPERVEDVVVSPSTSTDAPLDPGLQMFGF